MSLSAADSIEILQLVARADACATARDADGYAALFTEDAAMTGTMGDARGRPALTQAVAAVWAREPSGTLHLTLNAVIDDSASEPSVESVLVLVGASPQPGIVGTARVLQRVRNTPEGWRISSRLIAQPGRPSDGVGPVA
jgi:uncharacterized protein (TIGR02246 family)